MHLFSFRKVCDYITHRETQSTESKCDCPQCFNASTKSDLGRKGKTELRVFNLRAPDQKFTFNITQMYMQLLIGLLCQHKFLC